MKLSTMSEDIKQNPRSSCNNTLSNLDTTVNKLSYVCRCARMWRSPQRCAKAHLLPSLLPVNVQTQQLQAELQEWCFARLRPSVLTGTIEDMPLQA